MKNIIKQLSFIALVAVFFTSCEDAYEIDQVGRLEEENGFESIGDLAQGLSGVYNRLDLTPNITFNANFTDEVSIGLDNGGQGLALYAFNLNAGSTASSNFWVRNYSVINAANRVLRASDNIEFDQDDPAALAEFNNILAHTRFIRAYAHFELLTYYSPDMTDDNALSAIIVDFVPDDIFQVISVRNTNAEVYNFIEQDIQFALDNITGNALPNVNPIAALSEEAIHAFRARMYTYKEDYTTARDVLENDLGINAADAGANLATALEYPDVFTDASNAGVIWKLERTIGDTYDAQGATGSVNAGGWAGASFAFINPTLDGSPYLEMDRKLFDELEEIGGVRIDVNVNPTSIIADDVSPSTPRSQDVIAINKYPGSEGQPLMNDLKVYRWAEMYLLLAEVEASVDNFNEVATILNNIRTNRQAVANVSVGNTEDAFAAILRERRVELAFEGHRYVDIKRLGEKANVNIERGESDCVPFGGVCTLESSDYRFNSLPIPIVEFNANPDLRQQQNPGY
ncbi:RagB/SusD family nutrient uptake outer membrane protein [Psychroflexus sp. ALD_RP9]|uniref:RagB/SusD family nutrient uptake outer membrane protein n=1 Tax=Psychroflexus sp. ALD_RP9 TaxID=2777186 RepID=UPI001A8FE720|nr:RagB/SusD family nutrient uptake outer membrane protein [Psychroflexus sp. ALD_RP9]QSS97756.1 RagB/SusD family nutrient uptake outer membrane protein [Psychroflexus sp. ALD_RP9]